MRFAIAIPQFYADGEFDPAAFRAYLARAEELGFESAWAMEQVLGSWNQLSPMEAMTYAAACTERLRLGCVVFVSTLHNPVHLAKGLATLDQLSRGRIEVGVGTGGKARPFAAFGVEFNLSVLAVLTYRGIAFWLPTLPGALAYLQLWRTVARWRDEELKPSPPVAGSTPAESAAA